MTRIDSFTHSMWIFSETLRYIHLSDDPTEDFVHLKESWADQIIRKMKIDLEIKGEVTNRDVDIEHLGMLMTGGSEKATV